MEKFYGMNLRYIKAEDMQDIEEAAYVMRALDADIARIEGRLSEAKVLAATKCEFSNPSWFHEMTLLMKALKRARVVAQDRRGALGRQEKQAFELRRNAERCQQFVDAARMVLSKDEYRAIWSRVDEMAGAAVAS